MYYRLILIAFMSKFQCVLTICATENKENDFEIYSGFASYNTSSSQ